MMNLNLVLLIGAGGFLGSVLRYVLTLKLNATLPTSSAIWLINVLGSFLIGIVIALTPKYFSSELATILSVGVLGGFTTFSAFSSENLNLFREGRIGYAALYIFSMVTVGLFATAAGYKISS